MTPDDPLTYPTPNAERLPAAAGWAWLRLGASIFRRHPTQLLLTALNAMFVGLEAMWIPLVGPFAALALFPALTMFVLEACRTAEQQEAFSLPQVFRRWAGTGRLRALARLGCAYAAAVLSGATLCLLIYLPELRAGMAKVGPANVSMAVMAEMLRKPLLASAIVSAPITMAFWYAPMLVGWHGLGVRKALFFSMVACWRNKWAFLVYGLAVMGLAAGLDLLLSALYSGLGLDAAMVRMIGLPLQILFLAVVYCSFYPSYTTVFRPGAA